MEKATRAYWGDFYEAEIGSLLPVPEDRIGLVNDGDAIDLGDRALTVIHTPGHAKHHLCLYDGESGDLFCGEAVGFLMPGELKVIPISSPPVFEVTQALDSINKMRKLMISRILFSHYGVSDNPARCLDLAEESIKTWGDLVLRALKAHKSRAEIKASLAVLLDRRRPEAVGIFSQLLEWAIDGYSGYFVREGMASDYPGRRI
jgi:glyoxylase-like metal-dependent hydrolase (beta-lactamase superfamily II)